MAAALLRKLDEPPDIGVLRRPLDEQMHMVRHEAVRQDRELLARGRPHNLIECESYRREFR